MIDLRGFWGKNVIFFGFVGGVVGMVEIVLGVDCDKVIGFDMGGILIDVFYFVGNYECVFDMFVVGI